MKERCDREWPQRSFWCSLGEIRGWDHNPKQLNNQQRGQLRSLFRRKTGCRGWGCKQPRPRPRAVRTAKLCPRCSPSLGKYGRKENHSDYTSDYHNAIDHHIIPKLGNVKLEKLTMLQIQQFYNELLKSGRVQKKNQPELKEHGLSPRMVQCVHVVLNKALEHAVEEKLILANPVKKCKIPKNTHKEMNILPEALIGPYLSAAKAHGILAPMYLELTTGLRRGELLALRWEDLDVQNRTLSINKSVARQDGKLVISTPKTPNSIRTVLLPEDTVKLLVEEHERHPANPYLFPSPRTGETWDPDGFRRLHDRIINEIGAEHVRFHDMRHTFATLSLKSGVDVRTLSETLGHFSAGFTLSTYVHSTPGMKQSAADAIGNTIRNAI